MNKIIISCLIWWSSRFYNSGYFVIGHCTSII